MFQKVFFIDMVKLIPMNDLLNEDHTFEIEQYKKLVIRTLKK